MQSGQPQIKIDTQNLIKAGTIPVILAAIGGALWLLGFLGGLLGILFWAVALFAGYWYVNLILKSGAKPSIVEVAINGAILGAVVGLVYAIIAFIAFNIRFGGLFGLGIGFGFGEVISTFIQGAIAGAIAAAGWYAYKSGMIKTS
ncbi:MAG TPA: hypothetical protein VMP08_13290 [Anaerolineae bacterium]|nr:hypothetical protein [Anaerolineae bacterium]